MSARARSSAIARKPRVSGKSTPKSPANSVRAKASVIATKFLSAKGEATVFVFVNRERGSRCSTCGAKGAVQVRMGASKKRVARPVREDFDLGFFGFCKRCALAIGEHGATIGRRA